MSTFNPESSFRQFLGMVVLVLAVVIAPIWLWVIKEPLAYQSRDYPILLAKMELLKKSPGGGLTIIGDSRAMTAMVPARLGPGVVNLAWPGETPIEAFYFARLIVAKAEQPQAVALYLSPYEFVKSDWFWNRSVGFGFLHFHDVNDVRRESRLLNDNSLFGTESPGDVDARLKTFLYAIKFPSYFVPALINSRFNKRYAANREMLETVLLNRGQGYFGMTNSPTDPDLEAGLKAFKPSPLMGYYFDQTLALFQSRHIPVYFIFLPHNSASIPLYPPHLKEEFYNYVNSYAGRHPNFHLLGAPLANYPSGNFGDAYHLNENGATLFSDQLARLLNDSRVEGGPFGSN